MTRNTGRAQCAHTADPCNKAAQSHTPQDCCVRFAVVVAFHAATLATGRALPLTRTGLSPAGTRQLSWRTKRPAVILARKQPMRRSCFPPVGAQHDEALRRQHDVAVAAALALINPDQHAAAVDIGEPQ